MAGEHANARYVAIRYKSAPKVVKLFVKHNSNDCVRHIRRAREQGMKLVFTMAHTITPTRWVGPVASPLVARSMALGTAKAALCGL